MLPGDTTSPRQQERIHMTIQVLELRLHDITAADYIAWCVDPDPMALGLGLRTIALDADPTGDTITVTLEWDAAPPSPNHAARAAGLPVCGTVRELRDTAAVAG
jgi:hypothetical protein